MEKETFAPHLKTEFRVRVGDSETLPLTLVEVSDLERTPGKEPRRGKKGFSLVFTGARTFFLPQQMYILEHDVMGRFDLFLVPVHPEDGEHFYYEAIFNFL
ncbi:MAG TPA: hypothetical protein VM934_14405 [Pyrinomonadaceae bacterium]|nr:hypothetical protein [Pyrinomonadaceae bacterium]